jgi:hypothetical protein
MAMAALALLLSAVSHAQQSPNQLITQTLNTTGSLVNDLTTQTLDTTTGLVLDANRPTKPVVRVPEPSATVLLLMGLSMSGLGSYYVERRKRRA